MALSYATRGGNGVSASTWFDPTAFTYLTWVNLSSVSSNSYGLMGVGSFGSQTRKDFSFTTSGNDFNCVVDCSTTDGNATSTDITWATNTWYCLGATFGGIGTAPKLYWGTLSASIKEAVTYSSQTTSAGSVNTNSGRTLYIGNIGLADRSFIGSMAVSMIWNRALSLGELKDQQYTPHVTSGCVLYYQLGFTGTTSVTDYSGLGHTGSVFSGSLAAHVPLSLPSQSERDLSPYKVTNLYVPNKYHQLQQQGIA